MIKNELNTELYGVCHGIVEMENPFKRIRLLRNRNYTIDFTYSFNDQNERFILTYEYKTEKNYYF